jgi:O-antigen/teichoic acid export membrane protein
MRGGIVGWLWQRRDSARNAFIFRLLTMGAGMLLSLYWIRVLNETLGKELYGLFISFMAVTRLWSLGEAGLGSAVALLAIPMLVQQRHAEVARFVAAARTLFLLLAGFFGGAVLCLSPWLPDWLNFQALPGAGSLTVLFVLGGAGIALGIIGSYVNNLNYAQGTVAWPVLPAFVVLQLAMLGQVLLAKSGRALWIQYVPHLAAGFAGMWVTWLAIKWASPALSTITPLPFDKPIFKRLLTSGFWIYLGSLGNLLFTTTSQLVINGGFGPELVTPYFMNYKIPELTYAIMNAAGLVAFAKIARLVNSPAEHEQRTGRELFSYLQRLQIWVTMGVAVAYVFLNNKFIELWLGADLQISIYVQLAFAANLVFAAAGDAGMRGISMFSDKNLAYFGRAIFAMGVLNLALSVLATKYQSLVGIAVGTAVAQFALNCLLAVRVYRDHGWTSREFLLRTLVHPLIFVGLLCAVRLLLPMETISQQIVAGIVAASLLVLEFWVLKLRPHELVHEAKQLLALLRRG